MKKKRKLKRRSPEAAALRAGQFRPRTFKNRKKEVERLKCRSPHFFWL